MRRIAAVIALPPIALGAAFAAFMIAQAPGPVQDPGAVAGQAVRVAPAKAQAIRPVARGWGAVRAAEHWIAAAEVRGQVIWRHPDLDDGRMIAAGTEVLKIDPTDYQLAIAQAEADLLALAAESTQIAAEAENTARVLALEEERLALAKADLARIRDLVKQGVNPQTRADEAEKALLQTRRGVTELRNALALVPAREAGVAARRARTEAALARARRDLEHTVLRAPFDLRVSRVAVELYLPVSVGQVLVEGDGVARAEVVVQVPLPTFQRLIFPLAQPLNALDAMRAGPEAVLSAKLHPLSAPEQTWAAKVERVEGALDPRARSVPVVVSVAAPYENAAPPLRLPLVPNMQVEVALTGPDLPNALVIPEAALHGEMVYLVTPDNRLELRKVAVAFRQDGLAVIGAGLVAGERLVLDDLAPALPGLALVPVEVAQ